MFDGVPKYLPGDKVYYTGERFKGQLNGKPGWIHAAVQNDPDTFVVEFPDTRNGKDPEDTDDYLLHFTKLTDRRPAHVEKKEGPEVQPRRRAKRNNNEEE